MINSRDILSLSSGNAYISTFSNTADREPIILQATGIVTLFGLNSHFSTQLPSQLLGQLAAEEFNNTVCLINETARKNIAINMFCLVCGCIPLCCTLGCSMVPAIYFNKRTIRLIHELLETENNRLYKLLGLRWSLCKKQTGLYNLVEYVIVIDFCPKANIYNPD